jgi:plasmid stabilization system protein ParE
MAYRVNLTDRVLRELDDIHAEINVVGSAGAARWFSRMEDTIQLLASSPRMGKPAREASGVREIIYGKKPHLYRILYEVDEKHKIGGRLKYLAWPTRIPDTQADQGGRMKRKYIPAEEVFARWRKDPEYVAAYDALEEEFALAASLIRARAEAEMTQEQEPTGKASTTHDAATHLH